MTDRDPIQTRAFHCDVDYSTGDRSAPSRRLEIRKSELLPQSHLNGGRCDVLSFIATLRRRRALDAIGSWIGSYPDASDDRAV